MYRIADDYEPTGSEEAAVLQEFNSFRQALNVASADQRLLVFVNTIDETAIQNLQTTFSDENVVGKFHLDIINPQTDGNWGKAITGANEQPAIFVIQSGQFGIDGKAIKQLPLGSKPDEIKLALAECNQQFAQVETRKDYGTHVAQGRRQRVYFENEIPYGEDRNRGGSADKQKRGKGGQRGQRRRGK